MRKIKCSICGYSGKSAYSKNTKLSLLLFISVFIIGISINSIFKEEFEQSNSIIYSTTRILGGVSFSCIIILLFFGDVICPECLTSFKLVVCSNCGYKGKAKIRKNITIRFLFFLSLIILISSIIIMNFFPNLKQTNEAIYGLIAMLNVISLLSLLTLSFIYFRKRSKSCSQCSSLEIKKLITVTPEYKIKWNWWAFFLIGFWALYHRIWWQMFWRLIWPWGIILIPTSILGGPAVIPIIMILCGIYCEQIYFRKNGKYTDGTTPKEFET